MGFFLKLGIFTIVKKIITKSFYFVYLIISAFNLQFTLFLAILGLILYLCGVFAIYPIVAIVFYVLLGLSIIYAVVRTITKLVGFSRKKKGGVQLVKQSERQEEYVEEGQSVVSVNAYENQKVEVTYQPEKPKYYRVKQNPNYLMAEYNDRTELYLITDNGLKKIKTDLK